MDAPTRSATWERLLAVREQVNAALEEKRKDKVIGTRSARASSIDGIGPIAALLEQHRERPADALHRLGRDAERRRDGRRRRGARRGRKAPRREVRALLAVRAVGSNRARLGRHLRPLRRALGGAGELLTCDCTSAPAAISGSPLVVVVLDQAVKALVRPRIDAATRASTVIPGFFEPDARPQHRRGVRLPEHRRLSVQDGRRWRCVAVGGARRAGDVRRDARPSTSGWRGSGLALDHRRRRRQPDRSRRLRATSLDFVDLYWRAGISGRSTWPTRRSQSASR